MKAQRGREHVLSAAQVRRHAAGLITKALVLGFLVPAVVLADSNLPPSVQADLLRNQIYSEAKTNDPEAVLRSIDQYKGLGVDFPTPLLWIEAKAAHDAGDAKRALTALGEFLAGANRDADQYKEALALYPQYQKDFEAANSQQEQARRAALVGKVREVVFQLEADLVKVPGGDLATTYHHVLQYESAGVGVKARVKGFSITRHVITSLAWHVFLADTGRASDDGWRADNSSAELGPTVPVANGVNYGEIDAQSMSQLHRLVQNSVAFATWISAKTGQRWQVPSESQMAYIAQRDAAPFPVYPNANDKINYITKSQSLVVPNGWELVGDCWHNDTSGAPRDGSAWTSNCAEDGGGSAYSQQEGPVFIYFRYQEGILPEDLKCGVFAHCRATQDLVVYLRRRTFRELYETRFCPVPSDGCRVATVRLRLVREDQ